jgi:hypothetical protein
VQAAASQGAMKSFPSGCQKKANNIVAELILILKSQTKLEPSNLTESVLHRYHLLTHGAEPF